MHTRPLTLRPPVARNPGGAQKQPWYEELHSEAPSRRLEQRLRAVVLASPLRTLVQVRELRLLRAEDGRRHRHQRWW